MNFQMFKLVLERAEDEMAGWHHWLNAHEFGWTLGVGDGQGGLVCCDSWGRKESDATERLNWTEVFISITKFVFLPLTLQELHFAPIILCVKCVWSRSVVSDSLRPHGLLRPWDSPGKNTGVGCHFLLQGIFPTQGLNRGLLHWRQML